MICAVEPSQDSLTDADIEEGKWLFVHEKLAELEVKQELMELKLNRVIDAVIRIEEMLKRK